jgi:hypothetical protein
MIIYTVTNTTTDGRKERIKSAQNPFHSKIRCSLAAAVTNTTTDGRKDRIKSAQNPFHSKIRCSLLTHHPKINLAQRSKTHEYETMADA